MRGIHEGKLRCLGLKKRLRDLQKKNGGINITIVAEKPKVARVIAKTLANGAEIEHETWEGHTCHSFHGEHNKIPAWIRVISVLGHIYK